MALPWTLPDPKRGSPNGPYHCPTCQDPRRGLARVVRAGMHCGYLPRSEWPERIHLPVAPGPDASAIETCPGWLVRQQGVADGAEAYAALEAGVLDRFDPLGLRVVYQAAMIAKRAFNMWEAEKQARAAAEMRSR